MSALLNLDDIIVIILIAICTACYAKSYQTLERALFEKDSENTMKATFWKLARLGERLSPWISFGLLFMGFKHFLC